MAVLFWGTVALFIALSFQLPFVIPQLIRIVGQWLYYWAAIYVSWQLANFIWRLKIVPKRRISPLIAAKSTDQKRLAVFITGCDTGFGHLLAKKCHTYGFKVFAGCLFPDGEGAQKLKEFSKNEISVVKLDVTQDQDVANARKYVEESLKDNERLWAVFNNAGIMATTEIEFGGMTSFVAQMDINALGPVRVTKAFLPLLRRCPIGGRVINVASLAGRFSIPGMVGYCMSKSCVISFSDGLRREMKKWNIEVVTIEPHLFRTNLCDSKAHYAALAKAWRETPQDIKEDYGDCYFNGYQNFLNKILGSARSKISDVVETMFDALTHESVSTSYRILTPLERLRIWVWECAMPHRALDTIAYWGCRLITGKPARALKSQ